jgi:hypothetical protein
MQHPSFDYHHSTISWARLTQSILWKYKEKKQKPQAERDRERERERERQTDRQRMKLLAHEVIHLWFVDKHWSQ